MIGLGSNRLSVCRRGGMSVTQAGRGGMEWLGGFRAPSWASPYSAQATAALKAQFPTQWPTIRDYGFAHPEIVPYVNATPMIAPYLSGVLEPDEQYAYKCNTSFTTPLTTSSTMSFKTVSFYVARNDWKSPFTSAGWGTANSVRLETTNSASIQMISNGGVNGSTSFPDNTRIGHNFTFDVNHTRMALTSEGTNIWTCSVSTWQGLPLSVGTKDTWQWKYLQVFINGVETNRYYALSEDRVWDYKVSKLYNMSGQEV